MPKRFRQALLDALASSGTDLSEVARVTGVSYEQLKKLAQRQGASTNVDDARLVANFFGLTLDEFLGDGTVSARAEMAQLYDRLTPSEQRMLQAAARGLAGVDPKAGR